MFSPFSKSLAVGKMSSLLISGFLTLLQCQKQSDECHLKNQTHASGDWSINFYCFTGNTGTAYWLACTKSSYQYIEVCLYYDCCGLS